jgi:hypothetical protein
MTSAGNKGEERVKQIIFKIINSFAVVAMAAFLVSCQESDSDADTGPVSPQSIHTSDDLYARLIRFSGSSADPYPYDLEVEDLLPYFHPWLTPGRGLREITVAGHSAYYLRPIPKWVMDDIVQHTDDKNTGFLITRKSFWLELKENQDQGIRFGFLAHDPKYRVGGVTFQERNLILFDVMASQGSLVHELRHIEQYKRLSDQGGLSYVPTTLTPQCLWQASQFFAELDATTYELPTWKGVFKDFDVNTALQSDGNPWQVTTNPLEGIKLIANLSKLVQYNLSYPDNAVAWLTKVPAGKECPKEFFDAVDAIRHQTFEFGWNVGRAANNASVQWTHIAQAEQGIGDASKIPDTVEALKKSLAGVDAMFDGAQEARMEIIRKSMAALPPAILNDLCEGAQGVQELTGCKPENDPEGKKAVIHLKK